MGEMKLPNWFITLEDGSNLPCEDQMYGDEYLTAVICIAGEAGARTRVRMNINGGK
jgi:hypothetical protein